MTLKEYIHNYCKQHNITIKQLAENANLPRSSLYNLMNQQKSTTLVNLTKVAIAMQVHPYYLIKLEWQKYMNQEDFATPVRPLIEPELWFDTLKESSHFVAETIPDGSIVSVSEVFTKTWRVQNTGNTCWKNQWLVCKNAYDASNSVKPQHLKDKNLSLRPTQQKIAIPTTQPGETVDLSIEFTAPDIPARVISYWKMTDEQGNELFPDSMGLYVQVEVVDIYGART